MIENNADNTITNNGMNSSIEKKIIDTNSNSNNNNDNNKKNKKIDNKLLDKLRGTDEIPFRVETDLTLKNRKIISQYDYYCALSSNDQKRILHTTANFLLKSNNNINLDDDKRINNDTNNNKNNNKNNNNNNNNNNNEQKKKDISSIMNIKNKLSTIKTNILNQINSPRSPFFNSNVYIKTRFVWFDYHKKCKGGNVDALKGLFPTVKQSIINKEGFFSFQIIQNDSRNSINNNDNDENGSKSNSNNVNANSEIVNKNILDNSSELKFRVLNIQKNIVRTNCIDCLDRTNVVQTTIARWSLNYQLRCMCLDRCEGVSVGESKFKGESENGSENENKSKSESDNVDIYTATANLIKPVTISTSATIITTATGNSKNSRNIINDYNGHDNKNKETNKDIDSVSMDGIRGGSRTTMGRTLDQSFSEDSMCLPSKVLFDIKMKNDRLNELNSDNWRFNEYEKFIF